MEPSDLLARMSKMFRADVGPAIADKYPRTQAYLSAVVLQKAVAAVGTGRDACQCGGCRPCCPHR